MRILIAIDSFKGSLSSLQAGNAVKDAVLKLNRNAEVILLPLADGGEGTVEAFSEGANSDIIEVTVTGPLNTPVKAKYCIIKDTNTAVIEISAAAGLTLVPIEKREPLLTTTFGVGELIKDAIKRGCRSFITGLGGSATNDGGVGMLSALGFEFSDKNGNPIPLGAKGLEYLTSISAENVMPELRECKFRIACDVINPICGPNGCSAVFAPQKGAVPESIAKMDAWLENYTKLAGKISNSADMNFPGAGAAGGLGFAFLAFTNSTLESGVNIVLDEIDLEKYVKSADLVVTGEGRLDAQTAMGKAPIGVTRIAKKYGKKVIAFAGSVTEDAAILNDHGIDAYFSITSGAMSLEEAMDTDNAYRNLRNTAYQVFRVAL